MNFLSSLLKTSGAESGLSSALGAWRRAVSRLLDAMSAKYVIAYYAGAGQVIADLSATTTLILDTITANQGVPYDVATGAFTLEPNSVYELSFHAFFKSFNTVASDYAVVSWQDVAGNVLVSGTPAFCYPMASTENNSQQPVAHVIVKTTTALQVHAVATGGTGAASMGRSYAVVRKLGSAV